MKEYVTISQIAASPERVWEVLTDSEGYRHWNPEILAIDGPIALGQMSELLSPLILKSVGGRQPEIDRFSGALKNRAENL